MQQLLKNKMDLLTRMIFILVSLSTAGLSNAFGLNTTLFGSIGTSVFSSYTSSQFLGSPLDLGQSLGTASLHGFGQLSRMQRKKGIERRLAERSMEGLSCDACEFELIEGAFLLTQDDIDYINEFDNPPPDLTEEELIARIHEATGDAAEVIMAIASSLAPVPKVGLLKYARNLYKANKALATVKGITQNTKAFKHSFKYAKRVRTRALEDPVSHNFPYSFDDVILKTQPILKNNGYKIFQKAGTMNGKNGVFEIGLTKGGVIDHRFFRPY